MAQNSIIEERRSYLERNREGLQKILDCWQLGKLLSFDIGSLGWANLSCMVKTESWEFFVRLTLVDRKEQEALEGEVKAIRHLAGKGLPVVQPLSSSGGKYVERWELEGREYYILLFPMARGEAADSLGYSKVRVLGETLGAVQRGLADFPKNLIKRRFDWVKELGDLDELMRSKLTIDWPYNEVVSREEALQRWSEARERFLNYYFTKEAYFQRLSVNHGDFHLGNLRFEGDRVTAILDFDNLILAPRELDVAIAAHHLDLSNDLGMRMFKTLVQGYEEFERLDDADREVVGNLTQFYLWLRIPWLQHFSSNSIEGERRALRGVLAGIQNLESLRLGL